MKNVYPELKPPEEDAKEEKRKDKLKSLEKKYSRMKGVYNFVRRTSKIKGIYQISLAKNDLCIESEKAVTTKKSRLILRKCSDSKRQVNINIISININVILIVSYFSLSHN